jgi:hypothetical protein
MFFLSSVIKFRALLPVPRAVHTTSKVNFFCVPVGKFNGLRISLVVLEEENGVQVGNLVCIVVDHNVVCSQPTHSTKQG